MSYKTWIKLLGVVGCSLMATAAMAAQAPASAIKPQCMALHRLSLDPSRVDVKEIEMPITHEDSVYLRYEVDLVGVGYVVQIEKSTSQALVTLAKAPDYMDGTVANTTFNSEGRFTLSLVGTQTVPGGSSIARMVAKITCQR